MDPAQQFDMWAPFYYWVIGYIREGADPTCDIIHSATADMTMEQANRWFCFSEAKEPKDVGFLPNLISMFLLSGVSSQ